MAALISSKDVETVLRATLEGEGYEISKERGHGETGKIFERPRVLTNPSCSFRYGRFQAEQNKPLILLPHSYILSHLNLSSPVLTLRFAEGLCQSLLRRCPTLNTVNVCSPCDFAATLTSHNWLPCRYCLQHQIVSEL
jgi:hypothetical protein